MDYTVPENDNNKLPQFFDQNILEQLRSSQLNTEADKNMMSNHFGQVPL